LGEADEARLVAHRWPGNVRELENAIECAVVLAQDHLEIPLAGGGNQQPAVAGLKERVEAYERGLIVAALQAADQNRSEAARQLDISRATLHEKLKKYRIGADDE
jgi:two-component system response regulator HydG